MRYREFGSTGRFVSLGEIEGLFSSDRMWLLQVSPKFKVRTSQVASLVYDVVTEAGSPFMKRIFGGDVRLVKVTSLLMWALLMLGPGSWKTVPGVLECD